MIDNVLIGLTGITDENVLAVLSALQAFERSLVDKNNAWNHMYRDKRVLDLRLYLVVETNRYDFIYSKCLTFLKTIYLEGAIEELDWTYACTLSVKDAEKLAEVTKKHIALALGILLGAEASSLPDVSALVNYTSNEIPLLVDTKVSDYITEESVNFASEEELSTKIDMVARSAIVVGYSNFETYLACCLKKPVLEILEQGSLSKWDNKSYFCFSNISNMDDSKIKILLAKGISLCQQMVTSG